jgi:hypothetical protein
MKQSPCHLIVSLLLIVNLTSCSAIFRSYVNKKYPPVSSLQKSAASVQASLAGLDKLPKSGIGIRLKESYLDNLLDSFLLSTLIHDSTLGIKDIGQLQFMSPPVFALGEQEILTSASIRISNIQNKYVKEVEMSISGRISPFFSGDTLLLAPSFSSLHVSKLQLTKCIILGNLARNAVNDLVSSYMDNINGALNSFAVKISYPPLPREPLSQLLGTDASIQVITDDTFSLRPRRLDPILLVDTASLNILSDVIVDTGSAPPKSGPSPLVPANSAAITQSQFAALYKQLDTTFWQNWNLYLDTVSRLLPPTALVNLSYVTLSDMMNELWADADFTLKYNFTTSANLNQQTITLGQIAEPDCSTIPFNFSPNNCNNVLSNCGSCSWWDAPCWVGVGICETANGAKYLACQASNAAKLAAASAEWVAAKALCYTEVAGVFIVNKLILPVGVFNGTASAAGNITGTLNHTVPGGIESLGFTAQLHANVNANANISFIPSGLAGLLICQLPTAVIINNYQIPLDIPATPVNATMQRLTQNGQTILQVNTGNVTFPIQFPQPLILYILSQPQLVLSCSLGIFLGVSVGSVLALAGNPTFKNYLNAAFGGVYNWQFQKNLDINLPPIPISTNFTHTTLLPSWGTNSLIYQKN